MPLSKPAKELHKNIKEQIKELSLIDPKSLSRKDELGPKINFEKAVPYLEEYFGIMQPLFDRNLDRLPISQLKQIHSAFGTILAHVNDIRNFQMESVDKPADECKNKVEVLENAHDSIMEKLTLPLAFTATQSTDYSKIEREARGTLAQMEKERDRLLTVTKDMESAAKAGLEAVQKQVAEAGVSANAQVFRKESETHAKLAKEWLTKTYWFSTITILVAVFFFGLVFSYQPKTTPEAIQYVFAKLILLSTLMFALVWCAKNYKSHKHNETLNNHRANALNTFRTFYEGSSDAQVKNTILLQAAHAAFSNRSTGYEATHEKDAQPTTQVIDIFGKAVTPIAKASQAGSSAK